MVSFLNVTVPMAHFGLMIRRLTTSTSAGRPTEGLFRVRTSGRAIRRVVLQLWS